MSCFMKDACLLIFCLCFTAGLLSDCRGSIDDFNSLQSHKCGPCLCKYNKRTMRCEKQELKTFQPNRSHDWSWVEYLDLGHNHLRCIPDLSLFPNLTKLSLRENNKITEVNETSFLSVRKLESLDMTGSSLATVHPRAFAPLKRLRSLRMKQSSKPLHTHIADFNFLSVLNQSLEELYIDGTAAMDKTFQKGFPRLRVLSLGGANCSITKLSTDDDDGLPSLRKLQLKKLSLRNCHIDLVTEDYFTPLAATLHTIDVTCNPVHESLMNISTPLQNSSLRRFLGDYINHKQSSCDWNITSDYFVSSLEIISMSGNQIQGLSHKNKSKNLRNARYVDLGYNSLLGAALSLRQHCKTAWFWCSGYIGHKYQFLGIDSINGRQGDCSSKPPTLNCKEDSKLFENDHFSWEKIAHPDYLDIFIILDFFQKLTSDETANDLNTYINNNFNYTLLPPKGIIRIIVETVEKHSDTGITLENLLQNILSNLTRGPDPLQVQLYTIIAKYLCEEQHIAVLIEVMETWISQNEPSSGAATSSPKAIHNTIKNTCAHPDWNYGVSFFTDPTHFHVAFTNLTTLSLRNNMGHKLSGSESKTFCNNIVIYYNNFRHVDASYSEVDRVSCTNITGLEAVERIDCINCNNKNGWTTTASDLPNLKFINFSGNKFGKWIRTNRAFKGFKKIMHLILADTTPQIQQFTHVDMFSDQRSMTRLVLRNSGIRNWTVSIANNIKLRKLDLSENKIHYIDPDVRDDLKNAHIVSGLQVLLANNPIECGCDHKRLDFIKWILSDGLIADRKQLKCGTNIGAFEGTHFSQSISSFRDQCERRDGWPLWEEIVVIGGTGTAVLLAFIIALRTVTRRRKGYTQLPSESRPMGFISFPRRMEADVNALKEQSQDHVNLFSSLWGDLDGGIGESYSTVLSGVLKKISKVILIVSEHYFQDEGTRREYNLFENAGLVTEDKVILVLTTPNIGSVHLPPLLRSFYSDGNFLIWPMGPCSGQGFRKFVVRLAAKI